MTTETITRDQANAIADLFEKNGVFFTSSFDWQERSTVPLTHKGEPLMERDRPMLRPPYRYERFPDIIRTCARAFANANPSTMAALVAGALLAGSR